MLERAQSETGPVATGGPDTQDGLLRKIRAEFHEMPGLRLTVAQAARLWNLDAQTSEAAMQLLVLSGFLRQTEDGRYVSPASTMRPESEGSASHH